MLFKKENLKKIQNYIKEKNIKGYLIFTSDPHDSEYVAPHFLDVRKYFCPFSGSAAEVLILENEAYEKAWLFRVASNLSKNRISYNKIRSTDELNESLIAEEREDLSFVWEAVKELPVKYKEVIHLFYYEELSTAEIANILQKKRVYCTFTFNAWT